MLTIEPDPRSIMWGSTARMVKKLPVRQTSTTRRQESVLVSRSGAGSEVPALLTRTSMRPRSRRTSATTASTWCSSVTSRARPTTRRPVSAALRQPLEVQDLGLGAPRPGEIAVRLLASGVCASDVSVLKGDLPSPLPIVLGHEGAGVVTEVGEGVTTVAVGDHVVVTAMPQCGTCWRCRRGQPSLCEVADGVLFSGALRDGTSRFTAAGGASVAQMVAAGTFAEEGVVSAISAVRIPADVPAAPASLLGCGVLTGYGAAVNAAAVGPGRTVCVIGCGSVGLAAVQGARLAGAEQIIAVDLVAAKLDLALAVGATTVVAGGDGDVVDRVRKETLGRGVDVA